MKTILVQISSDKDRICTFEMSGANIDTHTHAIRITVRKLRDPRNVGYIVIKTTMHESLGHAMDFLDKISRGNILRSWAIDKCWISTNEEPKKNTSLAGIYY